MAHFTNDSKSNLLLKALADSSKLMIENKNIDGIINKILAILGKTAKVDRTYIFKNEYKNGKMVALNYEYEWCDQNVEPHIDNPELSNVPWDLLGSLKDSLSFGQVFSANTQNVTEPLLRQSLEIQHIKSVIFMPIFTEHKFWGFIGFDDCKTERVWDENEILTIGSIASNLGVYILGNELEKQLEIKNQEIKNRELYFENILNSLPADVVIFDTNQRYVFVNKNGIPNDEVRKWIIGKTDFEYFKYKNKPDDIAHIRKSNFEKVVATRKSISTEETFWINGEAKHHLRIMHPVFSSDNNLLYVLGYGIDITDLKQKEEIIVKQNHAIENSPVGIALLNKEGNYYYTNKAYAQMYEYMPSELIGKSWYSIYNLAEADFAQEEFLNGLQNKGYWNNEATVITKNGNKIFQEISVSAFSDGELVIISKDLTKTKEKLHQIQQMHAQLELAMKASNLGMWTYDMVQKKLDLSEAWFDLMKLNKDEVERIAMESWFTLIHPDDQIMVTNVIKNHVENYHANPENVFRVEYRILQKGGNYIWMLGVGKVSRTNDTGSPTEITGFALDINTQKVFDEKVKLSDKRYRDLVESLNEIIFQLDLNGNWTFLNSNWELNLGYEVQNCLNKSMLNFVHLDETQKTNQLIYNLINNNITEIIDVIKFVNKDKQPIWLNIRASLLKDIEGNLVGIVGSADNITAHLAVETELQKNKEILNKVVSSIDDIIWSFDLKKLSLSYISPSCKLMTGISDSDFYNKKYDWYEMVSPEFVDLIKESDKALTTNQIQERDITYKILFKNATSTKWVRDKAKLVFNENNEPIRIDGVTLDVTNLVLAEQKLKLSEEKYRLISENIQDVITILDTDGIIYYMSPSVSQLLGYHHEQLLNQNALNLVHEHDKQKVADFLKSELHLHKDNKILFEAILPNNDSIWVESIVTVLQNASDKVLLQASTRDVTPRINAELELKKALDKEIELNELKSRFINMASHQFRTPLATIRSSAELIKLFLDKDEKSLTPNIYKKVNEKINDIVLDTDSISELMTDVLTMGKIESKKVPFQPTLVQLDSFLAEYLSTDALKITRDREIQWIQKIKNIHCLIDKKIMFQVFENAISNAVKYSHDETPITIKLYSEKNNAIIAITDKGIGIPENELPFVFESFFRSTNVDNIPGTGLGTAIIKLFVEMHQGHVKMTSTLNKGTSLFIYLPIVSD